MAGGKLRIGVQSWTLRRLSFDDAVAATAAAGLRFLQLSPAHVDPGEGPSALGRKRALMETHRVVPLSFGVAESAMDDDRNRRIFEFARLLSLELLVVEPQDARALDSLERLASEYGIDVAVHNHGPGTDWSDPARLRAALAGRDRRLGVCLDSGWITAAGHDAVEVFRQYEGRVLDIHLKDLALGPAGEVRQVPLGEGDVNVRGLIEEARAARFGGLLAIESDADLHDPADFVRTAAAFVTRFAEAGNQSRSG